MRLAILLTAVIVAGCSPPVGDPLPVPITRESTLGTQPVPTTLEEALDALDRGVSGTLYYQAMAASEDEIFVVTEPIRRTLDAWVWPADNPLSADLARWEPVYGSQYRELLLRSWWRRLHGRPLQLEEARAGFIRQREADRRAAEERDEYLAEHATRLAARIIGVSLLGSDAPLGRVPTTTAHGRVRYMAAFRNGVVVGLAVPPVPPVNGAEDRVQPFFFDPAAGTMREVRIPEIEETWSAVVAGEHLWVSGQRDDRPVLVEVGRGRQVVPLPLDGGKPMLGTSGDDVVVAYDTSIFSRVEGTWRRIYSGAALPRATAPIRVFEGLALVRDDGRGGSSMPLWAIPLDGTGRRARWQDEALEASLFSVTSFLRDSQGRFWLAASYPDSVSSVIRRDTNGALRLVTHMGQPTYNPGGGDPRVSISAFGFDNTGRLLGAGSTGIYRISDSTLTPVVRFNRDEIEDWDPCEVLELAQGRFLVGTMWRGVYEVAVANGRARLASVEVKGSATF